MMRRTIYTCYSLLLATVLLPGTTSCTSRCGTVDESRLSYIDTRVGTAPVRPIQRGCLAGIRKNTGKPSRRYSNPTE